MSLVLASVLHAGAARSDALAEVSIDRHGPSQDLPLRSSFYFTGDAEKEKLQAVQPIFVRISWPVWGGLFVKDHTCAEIREGLGDLKEGGKAFSGTSGVVTVGEIWGAPKGALTANDKVVYLPSAWKRAAGDKTFKVLVGQPSFFQPGARYCMYFYQKRQLDSDKVLGPIQKYAADRLACQNKANVKICEQENLDRLRPAIKDLLAEVPEGPQKDAAWLTISNEIIDKADKIVPLGWALDDALSTLSKCVPGLPTSLPGLSKEDYVEVAAHPLLRAVLRLLVRGGVANFHNATFHDEEDKVEAKFAGFAPGLEALRIAGSAEPTAKKRGKIALDWASLRVPRTNVSLLDVIRLKQGMFGKGASSVALNTFQAPKFALILPAAAELDKMKSAARGLRDALAEIAAPGDDKVLKDLEEWQAPKTPPPSTCNVNGALTSIETSIQEYQDSSSSIGTPVSMVAASTATIDLPLELPAQIRMTNKDFITSYVTPTLGYGTLMGRDAALYYGGVQVFFWPNPVDEPMWSHGSDDWRRLFAVELGMALSKDPFGPQKQYSGFDSVPPVFLGIALQPAPYATFSFGRTWFSARQTSLPQEQPETASSFYYGFSVQANVPDIIRSIAVGSSATTTSSTK